MKAIGNSILFRYVDEKITEGGIYLTHGVDANTTTIEATVLSVGQDVKYIKSGDKVLIPKLMKTPVDMENGNYTTLEHQVLAILD